MACYTEREREHNFSLNTPVCILSYNRPDAPIFKSRLFDELFKDEIFVFIRNTEQAFEQYKDVGKHATLVPLPDWVMDVGQTRQAINDWAYNNCYEYIFVIDDRITKINFLVSSTSRTGKQSLVASKESSFRTSLLIWEQILVEHPFTVSCPAHAGFSYYPENINVEFIPNNGNVAACIAINIDDIFDYDIKYRSMKIVGHDDADFTYSVLKAGLPICKITDLEYDEVSSGKITSGGTRDNQTVDRYTICQQRNKLFWENSLGLQWGEKSNEVYLRKSGDGIYPYFNWKYWKQYYKEHGVKGVS